MTNVTMPAGDFKEVAPARRKGYSYVRVLPVEHLIDEVKFIKAVEYCMKDEDVPEDKTALATQAIEFARKCQLANITAYDLSEAVNSFNITLKDENETVTAWLDKATRVGLVNSLAVEKTAGKTESTLYLNGRAITAPIETLEGILQKVELYAIDCYRHTEEHKVEVNKMTDYYAITDYDYTTCYPEHLTFEL